MFVDHYKPIGSVSRMPRDIASSASRIEYTEARMRTSGSTAELAKRRFISEGTLGDSFPGAQKPREILRVLQTSQKQVTISAITQSAKLASVTELEGKTAPPESLNPRLVSLLLHQCSKVCIHRITDAE